MFFNINVWLGDIKFGLLLFVFSIIINIVRVFDNCLDFEKVWFVVWIFKVYLFIDLWLIVLIVCNIFVVGLILNFGGWGWELIEYWI